MTTTLRRCVLACGLALLPPAGLAAPAPPAQQNSGAIGQIVPGGGVVMLTGTPGATVREVRVRPGQAVKAGTVLMTLHGDALRGDLDIATLELQGARTLSGSQKAAQSLTVELAKQRLDEATRVLTTYRNLGQQATSASELARLQAAQTQARLSLEIEQNRLRATTTETDQAVRTASKRLELARAASEIRAPADGTILQIDRRLGQRLTAEPAIRMADLSTMYVTSQVYEGDLLKLRPGMKATIRNATLARPLSGTVEEVGRLVDTRSRLGEVRIKLDSPEPADRLVGMEVEVVIAR